MRYHCFESINNHFPHRTSGIINKIITQGYVHFSTYWINIDLEEEATIEIYTQWILMCTKAPLKTISNSVRSWNVSLVQVNVMQWAELSSSYVKLRRYILFIGVAVEFNALRSLFFCCFFSPAPFFCLASIQLNRYISKCDFGKWWMRAMMCSPSEQIPYMLGACSLSVVAKSSMSIAYCINGK